MNGWGKKKTTHPVPSSQHCHLSYAAIPRRSLTVEGRNGEIAPTFSSESAAAAAGHSPGGVEGELKGIWGASGGAATAAVLENEGAISPFMPSPV